MDFLWNTNFILAKALKEIRRLQKSTDLLIPKRPFYRVIREVMYDISPELRIQGMALNVLQEAAEAALVHEFESKYTFEPITTIANNILVTQILAIHAKRVTIQAKDMELVRQMRQHLLGYKYVGNPRAS